MDNYCKKKGYLGVHPDRGNPVLMHQLDLRSWTWNGCWVNCRKTKKYKSLCCS